MGCPSCQGNTITNLLCDVSIKMSYYIHVLNIHIHNTIAISVAFWRTFICVYIPLYFYFLSNFYVKLQLYFVCELLELHACFFVVSECFIILMS